MVKWERESEPEPEPEEPVTTERLPLRETSSSSTSMSSSPLKRLTRASAAWAREVAQKGTGHSSHSSFSFLHRSAASKASPETKGRASIHTHTRGYLLHLKASPR